MSLGILGIYRGFKYNFFLYICLNYLLFPQEENNLIMSFLLNIKLRVSFQMTQYLAAAKYDNTCRHLTVKEIPYDWKHPL